MCSNKSGEDLKKRPDVYDHIWEGDFRRVLSQEMANALHENRIDRVPTAPSGRGDSLGLRRRFTAIWFAQFVGPEVRLIDYYENAGVGLDHYARILQEKGYVYDQHILPHDVR